MGAPRPRGRAALGARLTPAPRQRFLYGRRRGRALRPGQQGLKAELLPKLGFELPETGTLDPAALFSFPLPSGERSGEGAGRQAGEESPRSSQTPPHPDPLPGGEREIWLEIGFGAGEHLAWQAAQNPDVGFLGAEVFENGVVKLLAEILRRSLTNIRILVDDARLLLAALPERSLGRVFILFPDPWPKQRHHKRRMVSQATLDELARTMLPGAELRLATDDIGYLRWMLELAPVHPAFEWLARGPGDWRVRPEDWPETRYEQKAIGAGRVPYFLRLKRRPQ